MTVRRLAILLAVGALVAGSGCGSSADPPAPGGSTLAATWIDRDGNGILEAGRGEPLRNRTDLAPARAPGRVLATAGTVTDIHVRDEESPARPTFLDRLGPPFTSTFRPQEALSTQVLTAAVRSLDAARPQAVVVTGDVVDSAQANEFRMAGEALRGGTVHPDSGARGYQGPQRATNPDPAYYRPGVDPPRHPGLLARAQRPFPSPGLRMPSYVVPGNHDLLVAGEIAADARTNAIATGDRMLVAPSRALRVTRREAALSHQLIDRVLRHGLPGQTIHVAPDPTRRELSPAQAVAALRRMAGRGGTGPRMDQAFDLGPHVRAILLDTVRRDRGAGGLVTPAQAAWVARELRTAGNRWVLVFSHQPLTSDTGGDLVLRLLDRDPRVVATLAGDTHHNRIRARHTPAGGYWTIQTASLADFPQQARILRLRATAGGGVALETWVLDTAPDPNGADIARRLAYLDAQGGRPDGDAGTRLDRNVRLFKAAPG
jgi:3',5'-cyclic AMP phosphodiesterase CpdA